MAKKLNLNKETLLALNVEQSENVAGGWPRSFSKCLTSLNCPSLSLLCTIVRN